MFVKPIENLKVADPALKDFLPPQGREVTGNDLYWARRIRDNEVTVGNVSRETPAQTAAAAEQKK